MANVLCITDSQGLREHLILHSWNSYKSLTESKSRFPHFAWPAVMTEEDTVYAAQARTGRDETEEELLDRMRETMGEILQKSEGHTCKSIGVLPAQMERKEVERANGRHQSDFAFWVIERCLGCSRRPGAKPDYCGNECSRCKGRKRLPCFRYLSAKCT
jgi:hypothetical protein